MNQEMNGVETNVLKHDLITLTHSRSCQICYVICQLPERPPNSEQLLQKEREPHHECCKVVFVFLSGSLELRNVDIALFVSAHSHNLHATHGSTGRVGAVSRDRNDAHITVEVTPRLKTGQKGGQA